MLEAILGTRIRERRKQIGVTQTDLARQIGISASYLNLIERNKRRIAGRILTKIAEALGIGLEELDGAAERRLLDRLREVAQLPHLQSLGLEEEVGELIGRFPGWARALTALAESEREANSTARVLADRLTHDPFFAETVHGMLTKISAVRSAAEILCDYDDIPEDRHTRFLTMIRDESTALSLAGEALAAYFDKLDETDRTLTPLDEVEALFVSREHRFEEIDSAAAELSGKIGHGTSAARLAEATKLAEENLSGQTNAVIAGASELETTAGRTRALQALGDYATGAILIPHTALVERAPAVGYDVEVLAQTFEAPVDVVCRRLLALPREAGVPVFGYFQANAAGTVIEMHGLQNLPVPRYTAACPLWVLYRAQQSPGTVMRQRVLFPTGARFVFAAMARRTGEAGFGSPSHFLTDMLVMSEDDAMQTVYAPTPSVPLEEVGPACRLCPRTNCQHRIKDPLVE